MWRRYCLGTGCLSTTTPALGEADEGPRRLRGGVGGGSLDFEVGAPALQPLADTVRQGNPSPEKVKLHM